MGLRGRRRRRRRAERGARPRRARRRTLLLDGGQQSNRAAEAIGGLLGNDRRPPAEFYAAGRAELEPYPSVEVRDVEAVDGAAGEPGFVLELADGASSAPAPSARDRDGVPLPRPARRARERWGHSVFHCPFCHGWEVRDRQLAVFGTTRPRSTGLYCCALERERNADHQRGRRA